MNGINCDIQISSDVYIEKKILINDFRDSDTLKEEIRKTTACYSKKGLNLISITSKGGFIHLKFSNPK